MRRPQTRKVAILAIVFATVSHTGALAKTSAPAVVILKSERFVPAHLIVHPGDAVTFENSDSEYHTVTDQNLHFDSGAMAHGARWTHRFTTVGTYQIFCAYHPHMLGNIVVTAGTSSRRRAKTP